MATKQQELIDGCFARAVDDEPLFVLKATDELAPEIVREWARRYLLSKLHFVLTDLGEPIRTPEIHVARVQKYQEALELADQMDAWRKLHAPAW